MVQLNSICQHGLKSTPQGKCHTTQERWTNAHLTAGLQLNLSSKLITLKSITREWPNSVMKVPQSLFLVQASRIQFTRIFGMVSTLNSGIQKVFRRRLSNQTPRDLMRLPMSPPNYSLILYRSSLQTPQLTLNPLGLSILTQQYHLERSVISDSICQQIFHMNSISCQQLVSFYHKVRLWLFQLLIFLLSHQKEPSSVKQLNLLVALKLVLSDKSLLDLPISLLLLLREPLWTQEILVSKSGRMRTQLKLLLCSMAALK